MSEATNARGLIGSSEQRFESVAYLVLAHAADEQLRLLTNALLSDSRSRVYLHLDAKVSDLDWIAVYCPSRLVLLSDRRGVNWGGYSIVEATLRLLLRALLEPSNQRFVLLSGACFPLKPPSEINDYIVALTTPSIAIWGRIDSTLKEGEELGRYVVTKFHPHDNRFLNPKTSGWHERMWSAYKWINARLPYERKVDLQDLWKGSQFFIIDRECAEICARPPSELVYALRYAQAPDEILFVTVIVRYLRSIGVAISKISPLAARQGAHFILKRAPSRRNFRERLVNQVDLRKLKVSDVADASASGALFARKCSPEVSNAIYYSCIGGGAVGRCSPPITQE